jgi:hypothetical protein
MLASSPRAFADDYATPQLAFGGRGAAVLGHAAAQAWDEWKRDARGTPTCELWRRFAVAKCIAESACRQTGRADSHLVG